MRAKIKNGMFLKTKKLFSKKFLLLFFAVAIVVTVGASVPMGQAQASGVMGALFNVNQWFVDMIAEMVAEDNLIMRFFNMIMIAILSLALNIISYFVYVGAWLIDIMLDPLLYHNPAYVPPASGVESGVPPGVLDSMTITTGWTVVRDMCNIFFIFFLLLIAFATILRIQKFGNTKALLVKFIISIFLINFSMVIAKIIIDVGQVFMYEIASWMGSFQEKGGSLTTIVDNFKNEINANRGSNTFENVIRAFFAVIYSMMLALIYIMLALFLLIRLVMFVILIILSPFAFLSIVLPSMSKYTSEWFDSLVKHSLFGPVFLFFIYLSATMANELTTHNYAETTTATTDMSAITEIISVMIPHAVALCMLWMVIPVTQRLGAAGSKQLIGGTMGLGKILQNSRAVMKIGGKVGSKAVGAPASRLHAYGKGKSEWYNKASKKVGDKLASSSITGRIYIKREVKEAQRKKEAVVKHEKIMENLPDKRKKNYVDTFTDPKAKVEAQQALYNLMAKDSRGATYDRAMKMGYEKNKLDENGKEIMQEKIGADGKVEKKNGKVVMENVKEFDEERWKKDYKRAVSYGMDTANIETAQPHLIEDKKEKLDKVRKIIDNGDEKKMALDALADEDVNKEVKRLLQTKQRYDSFINSKSQGEKDGLSRIKKRQLANMYNSDGTVKGGKENEVLEQRREIFSLSGSEDKLNALNTVEIKDGEVELNSPLDEKFAKSAVGGMNAEELVNQKTEFLKEVGYMIGPSQVGRINKSKFVTPEQTAAIVESMKKRLKKAGISKEYEAGFQKSIDILEGGVTKPGGGGGGPSPIAHSEPKPRRSVVSEDESVSNQRDSSTASRNELEELVRGGGFEKGIEVSGELGMGAPKEKNGRLIMGSRTIANLQEAFEADKEFAEEGTRDMIRHEEQHNKGPALGSSRKMEAELKKYSKQEGVFEEDIEKKRVDLHKKYYIGKKNKDGLGEGAGYEMQTEVQRVNEGYKDIDKFIKDEARMHVMTDISYEGIDKMGKIEYGPENSGLHRTHSAFIKQDTTDEITKRMEEMRQDLVAKHKAKKDLESEQSPAPDSGSDNNIIDGADNFSSSFENDDDDAKPKPKTPAGEISKTKRAVNISLGKDPEANIAMDKVALKALNVGGTVHKGVAVVGIPLKPMIEEDKKINEEKLAGADISYKEAAVRRVGALKKGVTPTILEHTDKYVGEAGGTAGEVLERFGEKKGGKVGTGMKIVGGALQNKTVQKGIAKVAKSKLDDGQKGDEEADKVKQVGSKDESVKDPKINVERLKNLGGVALDASSKMNIKSRKRSKDPVAETKMAKKALEIGGKVDKRIAIVRPIIDPLLDKQLEIDERRQGGEKISQWQEDREKFGALRKSFAKDPENMRGVGKTLESVGKENKGAIGTVATKTGKFLQSETAGKIVSQVIGNTNAGKVEEKPVKTGSEATSVSKTVDDKTKTETEKGTGTAGTSNSKKNIVESAPVEVASEMPSKSKTGAVADHQKSFDKVVEKSGSNFDEKMSQQIKEAFEEIGGNMAQKIEQTINIDSSQEPIDINFGKINDEVVEAVKKGIDFDDVKKKLDDVKKKLGEFGENNKGANGTTLKAGFDAAQNVIDRAQTMKNREEQSATLFTVTHMLEGIQSSMDLYEGEKPSKKKK